MLYLNSVSCNVSIKCFITTVCKKSEEFFFFTQQDIVNSVFLSLYELQQICLYYFEYFGEYLAQLSLVVLIFMLSFNFSHQNHFSFHTEWYCRHTLQRKCKCMILRCCWHSADPLSCCWFGSPDSRSSGVSFCLLPLNSCTRKGEWTVKRRGGKYC